MRLPCEKTGIFFILRQKYIFLQKFYKLDLNSYVKEKER